jgi:hypothetical protein
MSPEQLERFQVLSASSGQIPDLSLASGPAEERSVGGFIGNIGSSGVRMASDIGTAAAHPIQTLQGIGGLLHVPGLGDREAAEGWSPEQIALADFFKKRYGGKEEIIRTLYEDPVGFAADLSAVLSGGAGALRGGAAATKVAGATRVAEKLGRAAEVTSKTARAIDPVRQAVRGGAIVAKQPLKVGIKYTGAAIGAATGAGTEAVRLAVVKNTERFRAAMRGQRSLLEIVDDVRNSVNDLRRVRGEKYRAALREFEGATTPLSLTAVKEAIDGRLLDFRVRRTALPKKGSKGPLGQPLDITLDEVKQLDFSASAVGEAAQKEIAAAVNLVENWTDTSVLGLDALKRRLGDFYSDSSQARAFIASLEKEVANTLNKVPGYNKMTRSYAAATEVIELIDKEMSLSQNPGASVRKITNALNQNNNYRQVLLEALDEASGTGLLDEVAGSAFESIAPRGIMRPLAGGSLIYSVGTGTLEALPALALTSPRGMGELLTAISAVRRGAATIGRAIPGQPNALAYRPLTIDLVNPETEEAVRLNRRPVEDDEELQNQRVGAPADQQGTGQRIFYPPN